MINSKMSLAVRSALGLAAVATAMSSGLVFGQEETSDALEEVIVTGSLIKRVDGFESASPVVVSTAAEISASGISKVEDFLNSLPQLSAGQNSYVSNGASGTATLDLRGMGSSRTLVLINGRRMGGGGAYGESADTNQIPTAMLERVEVLTGGASTVYGADAVAGVVNFVMRKDFNGVELNIGTSGFMHDNDNSYVAGLMLSLIHI